MSAVNVISLVGFTWIVIGFVVIRFMQEANPYREETKEQKEEDEMQAQWLNREANLRKK